MFLDLNPGTVGLQVDSVDRLLRLAAEHGFGGVDLPVELIPTPEAADRAAELADAMGLFPLPCDFLRVDDEKCDWGLARLETILPRVRRAGCHRAYNHIWPGSNERDYEANFAWHVERVGRLHQVLRGHGVKLGLEFIGPETLRNTFRHPFLFQLADAVALADAVSEEVGIVLDTFHWYTSGGTLDDIRRYLNADRLVNVHVNDATAGRERREQMDLERALPLETGIIDAPGVVRVLREMDYRGPVTAEPFHPWLARFREMNADAVVAEVAESLHGLMRRSAGR